MASVTYAIVFSGQILEGHQVFSVKAHMSKMLKADADKMQALFSGKQVVLKRTPDKQQALKIGTALKKVGADVKIKAIKTEAPAAQPAEEGGLSLAPMSGYIVEPKPAPPAPQIDVTDFSLSEMNDIPLAAPKEEVTLDVDLSEFSVSENDGSPLVEPSNEEAPKIDAPDFGLDEPGAVLETLKEEVELLDPDVSTLTLADAGSDLTDESAKPPPPPPAPDVSSITLADPQ